MTNMSNKRTTLYTLFGIILGICLGIVVKNYRALEIVNRCNIKHNLEKNPFEIINLRNNETVENSQRNFVFIGVMTANNFLKGRAKAVYDTWGKTVPGRIAFFSSEGSTSYDLPVVSLKGVDDRYPPQKKSFTMLYYMYEHYIDKFEWFIRADDDVYIHTEKLRSFLKSIDSSKPQFIGQAGRGNEEEFGLLSLEYDENFCMGGPGVILSRETLRRVAPHIPSCLKNLYSTHEDVEIGRCVQKYAGIPCTWNYEMQSILHHNSSGKYAFTGNLKRKEVHSAITLHPIKQAPLMYRLHAYIEGLKAEDNRQQMLALHRDIANMKKLLDIKDSDTYLTDNVPMFPADSSDPNYLGDPDILGINPSMIKFKPTNRSEIQDWDFIVKSIYSANHVNPKRRIDSSMREALQYVISEIMSNINNFSRQRGRMIEYRDLLYGYSRVNALYGQDLILDLLLMYKKYRGKKMTIQVRRHLYVQRAFTDIFIREITNGQQETQMTEEPNHLKKLKRKVESIWKSQIYTKLRSTETNTINTKIEPTIAFILPLAGRLSTFKRFMQNMELVCFKSSSKTKLLIVLFEYNNENTDQFDEIINDYVTNFPLMEMKTIRLKGNFSRGLALDTATRSEFLYDDDILFFIDVDIIFNDVSLKRIRLNTVQNQQVYLPIVFSEYDPIERDETKNQKLDDFNDLYRLYYSNKDNRVDDNIGFFRQFGFGICAIYKSDILSPAIDGFNTDINGWGLEDVRFLDKIIKLKQQRNSLLLNIIENMNTTTTDSSYRIPSASKLSVFRSPDPTLVHIFHPINCDKSLDRSQYIMCRGTKANTLGNYKHVESMFINNKSIIDYAARMQR